MKHRTGIVAAIVAALIALMATVAGVAPVDAVGFERGPNPTNASLEATSGPFTVATAAVSDLSTLGLRRRPTSTTRPTPRRGRSVASPSHPASPRPGRAWRGSPAASRPTGSW